MSKAVSLPNMTSQRARRKVTMALSASLCALATSLTIGAASGESLQDAMAIAYRTNPSVQAQRAQLRANGELKYQALANLLPQITAAGGIGRADSRNVFPPNPIPPTFNTDPVVQQADLDQLNYSVNGDLLVFDGFRSPLALRQAADQIDVSEAQLVGVEQQLLSDVATAYFDVVRDMAVFSLNSTNVEVLVKQLDQASVRFRVGEITRTDVAQAEARLASARADLTNASAQLAVSRARYVQLVGQSPGTLEANVASPALPVSLDSAKELALQIAPAVLIAKSTERASKKGIAIARGTLAPTVSLNANYQFAENPGTFTTESETFSYGVRANVPIFQGGARFSQIRQAQAINDGDRQRVFEAERQVTAQVVSAWEQLDAAKATIISAEAAVEANNLALEGVRKEALVGSRSTLDVLNAELEALTAQVSLATAHRNEQVATYALLASIGMLTPQSVGVTAYDDPGQPFGSSIGLDRVIRAPKKVKDYIFSTGQ